MTDLITVLAFITLTAWIAGYREIESLIRDGSWFGIWFWIPFWGGKYNLDSYHFMGGLRRLLNVSAFLLQSFWVVMYKVLYIQIFFVLSTNFFIAIGLAFLHIPFYWWFFYYQRNVFMHIIARRTNRQYKYLIPLNL